MVNCTQPSNSTWCLSLIFNRIMYCTPMNFIVTSIDFNRILFHLFYLAPIISETQY